MRARARAFVDNSSSGMIHKSSEQKSCVVGNGVNQITPTTTTTTAKSDPSCQRMLSTFSMTGKVCVVTGAARGLGNLFARTFIESGCNQVVIIDLNPEDTNVAAKEISDWCAYSGLIEENEKVDVVGLGCDVSNEQSVMKTFEKIKSHFGKVDVLVTSAGYCEHTPAENYTGEQLRKIMGVNVEGSFYCAREAGKMMIDQKSGGAITLIGSMSASVINIPQLQTPYNFSKAAVKHMASSLAIEWAKYGIRVNCLSPGYIKTNLTKVILEKNPALGKTWQDLTPVGRLGDPDDLKGAIIYLSSDSSKFLTGIDLRVDGGYCLI